jgi:hypothetical protein
MNKAQLLEAVNKLPDDIRGIIVATDAEGNAYSFLDEISVEYVYGQDFESGYVESIMSVEDILEDSDEEEIPDDFSKVAVIWPV